MIDVDEGITLEMEEYFALCLHHRVDHRHLLEPPRALSYYGSVREWATGEVLGYLWFNPEVDKWVWFVPDLATEEVEELFS